MARQAGFTYKGRFYPPIAGGDGTGEQVAELTGQLEAATAEMKATLTQLDAAPGEQELTSIKSALADQQSKVNTLTEAHDRAVLESEVKALKSGYTDLVARLEQRSARKFEYPTTSDRNGDLDEPFAISVYKARKHRDPAALARLERVAGSWSIKALSEGATGAGGYLVPPQYIQDLVMLRRASAPMRGFVTVHGGINSNSVLVPTQTAIETVAWTAENAVKTSTDETFAQISVNIFTLAGIAKVSNQLVEDSAPAVDSIVRQSLARGLAIEEDRVIINGSGTGQPTGIYNTSGITKTAASAQTAISIYDDILAAIGRLQAAYFGMPDAILMSPRTWSKLQTAKDTTNRYLGIGTAIGAQQLAMPGIPNPTGAVAGAQFNLFGIPLIVDANVPNNLTIGGNSDRSAVFVGAFAESWLLERDGVRMDVSDQAGTSWETNQTWFRGEERVGFTAARLTASQQIITDVGP